MSTLAEGEVRDCVSNSKWYPNVVTTIRLQPGDDLKQSLLAFAKNEKLTAGNIVTAVGSLDGINIRLASASALADSEYFNSDQKFEIVSLVGTMEYNAHEDTGYGHFHVSLADERGKVVGGHLMGGCTVYTTAEVVIMRIPELQYTRVMDDKSGYKELKVVEAHCCNAGAGGVLWTVQRGFEIWLKSVAPTLCKWVQLLWPDADTCQAYF